MNKKSTTDIVNENKGNVNAVNKDEVFLNSLAVTKSVYDPNSRYDVDKYFIKGNFPCLFEKIEDLLYIGFRGTGTSFIDLETGINSISNMMTDLATWDGTSTSNKLSDYPLFKDSLNKDFAKLEAHGGFLKELVKYYQEIRTEILKYEGSIKGIILTGHSAGGALSTLMYYIYSNDITIATAKKIPIDYCVTFGSPRVLFDTHLNVELFYTNCKNLIRCFNALDIVSYLPLHKKTLFDSHIASGFIHIGTPFCLDSNIRNNSLNVLLLNIIKFNTTDKKNLLVENFTLEELKDNSLIRFMLGDKYLNQLAQCIFTAFKNIQVKGGPTNLALQDGYLNELSKKLKNSNNYKEKTDLVKDFYIEKILLSNPVGETPSQENFTILGITSSILGFGNLSAKAHALTLYENNITKLINREVDTRIPIDSPVEGGKYNVPLSPIIPTEASIMKQLEEEIMKEIESGKIVGMINDIDKGDLLIEY